MIFNFTKYSLLLSILGCETIPPENDDYLQDSSLCLNCGPTTFPEIDIHYSDTRPHVSLSPPMLLFYYTTESEYPYSPNYAKVSNNTGCTITIIDTFITDINSLAFGEDGNKYFAIEDIELPYKLEPNEHFIFGISFEYSLYQQIAQLVVLTTYKMDSVLVSILMGKVFIFKGEE